MARNTVLQEAALCSGCGVCITRCPTGAVTMEPDAEGFLTAVLDTELCTDCGRCRDVCPMAHPEEFKEKQQPQFHVGRHESGEVLSRSTSGGAFTALSDAVLRRGGVVYGADFDGELMVFHARADSAEGRDRMRVSKYVQSRVHECYGALRRDLAAGREVLFTGTPCQTAAVRALFGRRDNLILCDLICHGIASPLLWEEYLRTLAQEQGAPVESAAFRSKEKGWYRGQYQLYYTPEGQCERLTDTRFFKLYLVSCCILRPSCHLCPYADTRHAADLTIADYWGIEKYSEAWTDRRGVSLILTHTEKGRRLLEATEDFLHEQRAPEEALAEQKRLHGPLPEPPVRRLFWETLREQGFSAAYDRAMS